MVGEQEGGAQRARGSGGRDEVRDRASPQLAKKGEQILGVDRGVREKLDRGLRGERFLKYLSIYIRRRVEDSIIDTNGWRDLKAHKAKN